VAEAEASKLRKALPGGGEKPPPLWIGKFQELVWEAVF
jgi:hypothetical protein